MRRTEKGSDRDLEVAKSIGKEWEVVEGRGRSSGRQRQVEPKVQRRGRWGVSGADGARMGEIESEGDGKARDDGIAEDIEGDVE